MLCFLHRSPTGDMKSVYKIGPKTDPWGTPCANTAGKDSALPILTFWVWSDR